MQTTTLKTNTKQEPRIYKRRIGSTTYRVGVHFSSTNRETFDDKIIRLIRNESIGRRAVK